MNNMNNCMDSMNVKTDSRAWQGRTRRILPGAMSWATLAIGLVLAFPAGAEQADRSKPVNIEADSVQMDDLHKTSHYQGDVIMHQGTLEMHAAKVDVHQDAAGYNQATAWGNQVYFRQKPDHSDEFIEGWADRVDLDEAHNTVLLTGNARLKKGADEMTATSMLYNTETHQFAAKREAGSGSANGPAARVRASIFPKTAPAAPRPAVPLDNSDSLQKAPASHE